MYPPLWGLWTNQFVGGRLHEAMETATQVLTMALATGDPMLEIIGRHATSYTRYYRGEYDDAIAEAQAGLRHYSYDMDVAIAPAFQLSSIDLQHDRQGLLTVDAGPPGRGYRAHERYGGPCPLAAPPSNHRRGAGVRDVLQSLRSRLEAPVRICG